MKNYEIENKKDYKNELMQNIKQNAYKEELEMTEGQAEQLSDIYVKVLDNAKKAKQVQMTDDINAIEIQKKNEKTYYKETGINPKRKGNILLTAETGSQTEKPLRNLGLSIFKKNSYLNLTPDGKIRSTQYVNNFNQWLYANRTELFTDPETSRLTNKYLKIYNENEADSRNKKNRGAVIKRINELYI
jgi:hypothetical protein